MEKARQDQSGDFIDRVCMLEGCENVAPDMEDDCPNCGRNRCKECAADGSCDCSVNPGDN